MKPELSTGKLSARSKTKSQLSNMSKTGYDKSSTQAKNRKRDSSKSPAMLEDPVTHDQDPSRSAIDMIKVGKLEPE